MSALPEASRSLHAVRERLAACDYQETINFAFVEPEWEADFAGEADPIRLLNPIASQLSVMRSTLIGSLVANVRSNRARQLPRSVHAIWLRSRLALSSQPSWRVRSGCRTPRGSVS